MMRVTHYFFLHILADTPEYVFILIHRQQDANIGQLQDTVAAQAEQIAANKAAQDEQKDLTDAKFAELYKALSVLGQPVTKTGE